MMTLKHIWDKAEGAYWLVWRAQDRARDFLRGLLINRHHVIDTRLPIRAWYDSDTRLLHGMMSVLVDFMEKDKIDIVDWDADDAHRKIMGEFRAIYAWWKDYGRRQQEIEDALSAWHDRVTALQGGNMDEFIRYLNMPEHDPEERRLSDRHLELENRLAAEEQEMLFRLVAVRQYMWT